MAEATTKVSLPAVIDETYGFQALLAPDVHRIDFDCSKVKRINSAGVRKWMEQIGGLREGGVALRFYDCPSCLCESAITFKEFFGKGEVQSVLIPYFCPSCEKEFFRTLARGPGRLPADESELRSEPCPKCGRASSPDLANELLALLKG